MVGYASPSAGNICGPSRRQGLCCASFKHPSSTPIHTIIMAAASYHDQGGLPGEKPQLSPNHGQQSGLQGQEQPHGLESQAQRGYPQQGYNDGGDSSNKAVRSVGNNSKWATAPTHMAQRVEMTNRLRRKTRGIPSPNVMIIYQTT